MPSTSGELVAVSMMSLPAPPATRSEKNPPGAPGPLVRVSSPGPPTRLEYPPAAVSTSFPWKPDRVTWIGRNVDWYTIPAPLAVNLSLPPAPITLADVTVSRLPLLLTNFAQLTVVGLSCRQGLGETSLMSVIVIALAFWNT